MSDLVVAVTGGIGSGKSTVVNLIKDLGYTVFSADAIYKELLGDSEFFNGVLDSVGVKYSGDKKQSLKEVASLVFSNKDALKRLNDYTHPKIMQKMFELNKGEKGVVFNEVPLLFEGGYQDLYNKVIIVMRSESDRIESVAKRDGLTILEVQNRIKNQQKYEKNLISKHTVIYNDGSILDLKEKVRAVVSEIIKEI